MKILIIGTPYLPLPAVNGGAIEGLVDDYLQYNSKNEKINITVYSPLSDNIDYEYNKIYINTSFRYINTRCLKYKFYKYFLALKRRFLKGKQVPTAYAMNVLSDLKKRNELEKYNLVIIENQVESLIEYGRKIKSKVVNHLHNDYLNCNVADANKIVASCSEFWCVSKFICNQIKMISSDACTKVLYNGVNIKKFGKVSEYQKEKMYEKIGFKKNDYIVLFTGRIMPEKGVLQLIKAFNKVKSKDDNLKLLIVGGLKNNSKECKNYLKKIDFEIKNNKDSIYIYGNASAEELGVLYSIGDLQVVPSMWEEAFGLIVIEGMLFKNSLIISNSGGMPEIVNESALIVDRKNIVEELAFSIKKIVSNKKLSEHMISQYEDILSNFTITKYCKTFENYILDICKK